jgi:hypothetical protein
MWTTIIIVCPKETSKTFSLQPESFFLQTLKPEHVASRRHAASDSYTAADSHPGTVTRADHIEPPSRIDASHRNHLSMPFVVG